MTTQGRTGRPSFTVRPHHVRLALPPLDPFLALVAQRLPASTLAEVLLFDVVSGVAVGADMVTFDLI